MKVKDHFLSKETFEIKPSAYSGILQTTPKLNKENLQKYYNSSTYISHQQKPKSTLDLVYMLAKRIMTSKKKKLIKAHFSKGSILDVGAGTGGFLNAFDSTLWNKAAIEPSEKLKDLLIKKGIKRYNSLKEVKEYSYEVITLWHSLEHIINLEETLVHLKKILKPNGVLFIAVPNYESYDAKYYKQYWASWDVPRHIWHFSTKGIKSLLDTFGFRSIQDIGMPLDAYYISLLSEKYKQNGFPIRFFVTGWLSNLKAKPKNNFSSITYVFKHKNNSSIL